ncbi:DUF4271 domain-containing protein [Flavitalea flava]
MPDKKFTLLFSFFLLFLCPVFAQTDSVRPPARSQDSIAPVLTNDSGRRNTDSTRRQPKQALKKTAIKPGGLAGSGKDSGSLRRDSNLIGSVPPGAGLIRKDSQALPVVAGTTTSGKESQLSGGKKGPDALIFWNAVLAANPFFNFTGPPVVEKFEMHRPKSKDSLFYLLVGLLFYFGLIRFFFEKYFGHLITLFFRVSLRQQQLREQVLQTPLPSLLLNLLFILTGGLYASFLFYLSSYDKGINFWILYLDCMMALGAIYLLKFLILKFCGWVFNISRATDIYIFVVFLVNKMMGIFLLPFLILITFSDPSIREIFITISLVMVFVLWGYRVLAAYRPISNEIKLAPFSFFLYLCAFEIAPLLLIYKVLLQYLEKAY